MSMKPLMVMTGVAAERLTLAGLFDMGFQGDKSVSMTLTSGSAINRGEIKRSRRRFSSLHIAFTDVYFRCRLSMACRGFVADRHRSATAFQLRTFTGDFFYVVTPEKAARRSPARRFFHRRGGIPAVSRLRSVKC